MEWQEVHTQIDIEKLFNLYGGFHDSCLVDLYVSTEDFVDQKLAMNFGEKVTAYLLFQRQSQTETVLELKFVEVKRFNFHPDGTVIHDAKIFKKHGLFYWADFLEWELEDNDAIWISGKKLFWRIDNLPRGKIFRIDQAWS